MDELCLENTIKCEGVLVKEDVNENERSKSETQKTLNVAKVEYRGYADNKNIAEGMMDIALLTANANQLRFLLTYNAQSSTFYISVGLVILSLILQVAVGIALILKRTNCRRSRKARANHFIVGGVFMVTIVNILVASLTSTGENKN